MLNDDETLCSVTPSQMDISRNVLLFCWFPRTDKFNSAFGFILPQLLARCSLGDAGFSFSWIVQRRSGFKFDLPTTATAVESLISAGVSTAR